MLGFNSIDLTFIQKLEEIIHSNLENENFGVNELARASGISYAIISRRLMSALNKSTSQFIREVRLKRALELLAQRNCTAAEVAYRVGFGTPAYFNTCFHAYYGYTPGEVLKNGKNISERENYPDSTCLVDSGTEISMVDTRKTKWFLSPRGKLIFRSAGLLLLIVAAYFILFGWVKSSSFFFTANRNTEKSISVLQFTNLSSDEENQYFADGIYADITNNLLQITDLRVVPSTTLSEADNEILNIAKIAKKLKVNYLLKGSIQRDGSKVRIWVQLIDARNNNFLWSESYDREFSGIFQIQGSIAKNVATALQAVITPKSKSRIERIPTRSMEAYYYCKKGSYYLNKRWWKDYDKGKELFEKAIATDPGYAEAYAGLAEYYLALSSTHKMTKSERYLKAKEYATKALELDDNNAEAHSILGNLLSFYEWKWEDGRKEFLRAIELNPNSPVAQMNYASFLKAIRQFSEARKHLELAIQLNPTKLSMLNTSANLYLMDGNYEKAIKECQNILELDSTYYPVYWTLLEIHLRKGDEIKALEFLQLAYNVLPEDKKFAKEFAGIYKNLGMKGVLNFLVNLEDPATGLMSLSRLYMKLGEKEKAMDCLEKVFEKQMVVISDINGRTEYDSLRNNQRFKSLLIKMGLDKYQGIAISSTSNN
jgi:TolB-like protein/AraC-like DNA-binding protein